MDTWHSSLCHFVLLYVYFCHGEPIISTTSAWHIICNHARQEILGIVRGLRQGTLLIRKHMSIRVAKMKFRRQHHPIVRKRRELIASITVGLILSLIVGFLIYARGTGHPY